VLSLDTLPGWCCRVPPLTGSLFALLPFEVARNTEVANLGVRDIQEASLSFDYIISKLSIGESTLVAATNEHCSRSPDFPDLFFCNIRLMSGANSPN
jgi:hypothetical protein